MAAKTKKRLPPIHPGEILREDFMRPLKLSMNKLALELRVPVTRIGDIVNHRRGITADTALRLGRLFGTTAEYWLGLQSAYDLWQAKYAPGAWDEVQQIAPFGAGAYQIQIVVNQSFGASQVPLAVSVDGTASAPVNI